MARLAESDIARRLKMTIGKHISLTGVVQGVGFRPFVYTQATRLGLRGWVLNHSGGVEAVVEGPPDAVADFIARLRSDAPPLARIESLQAASVPVTGYPAFEIRHSEAQAGRYQLISPDVATCPACLRELFDPADRRYRYPFINCTHCGPRYTIIAAMPYDRPNTTMRDFPLCPACRAEYENPADRRFHAQPNACPVCGPHLWLTDPAGQPLAGDAQHADNEAVLAQARDLLLSGKILALKGLGGFHLACDATNAEAVRLLRQRKRRPHKPFALMAPTLAAARQWCDITDAEAEWLAAPQAPILLLQRNGAAGVAADVAPDQPTLGVMLPYTPLHHLLLHDGGRPLVMTSGNRTDEPIITDNAEALAHLAGIADAFLLHNRTILNRCDDSVVRRTKGEGRIANSESADQRIGGSADQRISEVLSPQPSALSPQPFLIRRARGYAPMPIRLPFPLRSTWAAGALLKNTFTFVRENYAFVSPHIGDLEDVETLEHYTTALHTYRQLFQVEPERVACDLHPDYLSTQIAHELAAAWGLPAPVHVQHHHAHLAACLADNGYPADAGPVIGVAFDGTGYGPDGAIWGGEWFVGGYDGFARAGHLEYLPLPGGDAATRAPWRIAVAYLHALLPPEDFPAGRFCPAESALLRQQIAHRLNTPLTSSMGRLFDAVAALLNLCHTITYEAQAAIALEHLATMAPDDASAYPFVVESTGSEWQVRLAPLFEAILADLAQETPPPLIARRFHNSVAALLAQGCERLRETAALHTVALSGGVFQNQLLLALALERLHAAGFTVLQHRQVPCNDGGVSLGQAVLGNTSRQTSNVKTDI